MEPSWAREIGSGFTAPSKIVTKSSVGTPKLCLNQRVVLAESTAVTVTVELEPSGCSTFKLSAWR